MTKNKIPSSLYKFYNASRIDVLENLNVCFSSTKQLNDALEGIPPILNAIGDTELSWINDQQSQMNWNEKVIVMLRDKFILQGKPPRVARKLAWKHAKSEAVKLRLDEIRAQFATAIAELINFMITSDVIDKASENTGIFSMTESIDSGPMWLHYGQQFEGFALEFNLDHSFFRRNKNNTFSPKKVVYGARTIIGLSNARETDFFLTKSVDWSYEKEWRILKNRDEASTITSSGHSLFEIEPSVINAVTIGSKMSDSNRNRIEALVEKNSWKLSLANPNRDLGKIEISPI